MDTFRMYPFDVFVKHRPQLLNILFAIAQNYSLC
jgi:hypothetical protein